ncbi:reverse transcriptase-like protein, partial [Robertmurraya kyonggiensis]
KAKVIREVQYPEWLGSTVPVKKKNGKWRMCIDFTTLNQHCPKDDFPLPRIDSVVDDAANSEILSLLDCFSGYHQVWMKQEDEEKTSFITPFGPFCFVRMSEGLRNAGSTFSRMTKKVFNSQIDRNMLAYVDDLVVKSIKRADHIKDLEETFNNLRMSNLSLNPEKYVFGVTKGKVLGCLVTSKGIEANPDKVQALASMEEPKTVKEVQQLTGRIAALNRFVPRAAERSLPFFKTLRHAQKFNWGEEQSKAFRELKQYLATMIKLSPPAQGKDLLLYLAVSESAVSAAIVQEIEIKGILKQLPAYFVSEALSGAKKSYSELEKIAYALLMASRKLRHYFEAHKVTVVTNKPLAELFANREASNRISKWSAELSGFNIEFVRRNAIKSQVLADFVADWTSPKHESPDEDEKQWTVYCDGAYCNKGAAISAILVSPGGIKTRFAARLEFNNQEIQITNNVAEYEALLLGLRKMKSLGKQRFIVKTDSKIARDHIEKDSEARKPELIDYLEEVREMEKHFKGFTVEHIHRNDNNKADDLAKKAAKKEELPEDVIYEVMTIPSIRKQNLAHIRW